MALMFGKEAKALQDLAHATWNTPEERKVVSEEILRMPHLPVRQLMEVLIAIYQETDRKKKVEKLFVIEEILTKAKDPKIAEEIIRAFPRIVDRDGKRTALNLLERKADSSLDRQLVQLLREKDPDVRNAIAEMVKKIGRKPTFFMLKQALFEGEWESRVSAMDVAYHLGGAESASVFKSILQSGKIQEALAALDHLQKIGQSAERIICDAAKHEHAQVRIKAATILPTLQGQEPLAALVNLTQDPEPKVQVAALDALEKHGGSDAAAYTIRLLKDPSNKVRLQAVKVLSRIGDDASIQPLIGMLRDTDIFVRQETINTLGTLGKVGKVSISKLLIELMGERDVNIRRAAADVIQLVGDRSVLLDLIDYLRDKDWWVREQVATTLGELGGERIVDIIIKLLEDDDANIRRYAVDILNQIKSSKAIKPLTQMLKDPDWWIRERAVEALGNIGEKAVTPLLIKVLQVHELRWPAIRALGSLKDERAVESLAEILAKEDQRETKLEIMEALHHIGSPGVVEPLKHCLHDVDKIIRLKAEEILSLLEVELQEEKEKGQRAFREKYFSPLDRLLVETKEKGASDLFLSADSPPLMKFHGEILYIHDEVIPEGTLEKWLFNILTEEREERFRRTNDLDISYETPGGDRFRVNLYRHRLGIAAVFRVISDKVPTIEDLKFPDTLRKLCTLHQGIVLVTGPASCGKTTTLASLIHEANCNRLDHIITIEDPIEFIHENKGCLVNQREVGPHTRSFAAALRASLREDPDIILVGELRDLETITMAITAAETGHLVFGTLHTTNASKTVDRIIDAYPASQQSQIRTMLSDSIRAVISQQLCRTRDGGMVAALEILLHSAGLSKMIRDGKTFQIPSLMLTGQSSGMQTMDQALQRLVKKDIISGEEAFRKAFDKKEFEHYVLGGKQEDLPEAPKETADAKN